MCMVSVIMDVKLDQWNTTYPYVQFPMLVPSRAEFDALKQEVEVLRKLLTAAKDYDKITNQPDCEKPEKVALVKRIAELVGVDLNDILG
jgi:hypothetical protein